MDQLTAARQQVAATADPQLAAAQKLVHWASWSHIEPTADDFANLRLLLLALLPQLSGLILMVANQVKPC